MGFLNQSTPLIIKVIQNKSELHNNPTTGHMSKLVTSYNHNTTVNQESVIYNNTQWQYLHPDPGLRLENQQGRASIPTPTRN